MKHTKHPLLYLIPVLIVAALIVQRVQPVSASIELQSEIGTGIWFYQSCSSPQTSSIAFWNVDITLSGEEQTALSFNVENTYPGFNLECDLYFANAGDIPFSFASVEAANRNPDALILAAAEVPAADHDQISPCGFTPAWGTEPALVPADCRSAIHVSLTIASQAEQNMSLPFGIQVKLTQ